MGTDRISAVERFGVRDRESGGEVPCTAVLHARAPGPLPLCLFLYGGGGSANTLVEMRPLLERWWNAEQVEPMVLVCAEVGPMSFYLDDPVEGTRYETLVARWLLAEARERFAVRPEPGATGLLGISMGGYGALKIAFARPQAFGAVAVVQPMLEPAWEADAVSPRNRFHYPPQMAPRLLGEQRDAALFAANNPLRRAQDNAEALRAGDLKIFIEAADADLLNAHDGAELLHRVLWELDIGHEYRLLHEADHGGPTLVPRLREAAAWLGQRLVGPRPVALSPDEQAWEAWLDGGMQGESPPAISPNSPVFIRWLRAVLQPAREAAAEVDPTTHRRYGRLPPTDDRSPEG